MPSPSSYAFNSAAHLAQGKENEQLARALIALDSCYKDWVVTLAFYSAMHYIYSKLPGPTVPQTHTSAEPIILKECGNGVFKAYKTLSDRSRNAWYYPAIAKAYRDSSQVASQTLIALDKIKTDLGVK